VRSTHRVPYGGRDVSVFRTPLSPFCSLPLCARLATFGARNLRRRCLAATCHRPYPAAPRCAAPLLRPFFHPPKEARRFFFRDHRRRPRREIQPEPHRLVRAASKSDRSDRSASRRLTSPSLPPRPCRNVSEDTLLSSRAPSVPHSRGHEFLTRRVEAWEKLSLTINRDFNLQINSVAAFTRPSRLLSGDTRHRAVSRDLFMLN